MTSIGNSDEFKVNLLFDRYIYRPTCTHVGYKVQYTRLAVDTKVELMFLRYSSRYLEY